MKNTVIAIIVLIIVGIGGYFLMNREVAEVPAAGDVPAGGEPVSAYTVRYTDDGFSPDTLTVPEGTTVTFVNESSRNMWVGSDVHPTHTLYDDTNLREHCVDGKPSATSFDQCGVSGSYTFTFSKLGMWRYHNHVGAADKGVIIVE
jgi:plastocyanin